MYGWHNFTASNWQPKTERLKFHGNQTDDLIQRLKSESYVRVINSSNRNKMKGGYRRNLNCHNIYPNDRVTSGSLRRQDASNGFYSKYGDFVYYPERSNQDFRYSPCQEYARPSYNHNFKSTHFPKSFENSYNNQYNSNYYNIAQPYRKKKFHKQRYENKNNKNNNNNNNNRNRNKSQEKRIKWTSIANGDNKKEISKLECINVDLSDTETICLDDDETIEVDNSKITSNKKGSVVTCETQGDKNKNTYTSVQSQKPSFTEKRKNEQPVNTKKIKIISNIEVSSQNKRLIKSKSQQNLNNISKDKLDMTKDKSAPKQSCDSKKNVYQSGNAKIIKPENHSTSNSTKNDRKQSFKKQDNRKNTESIDQNGICQNMPRECLKPAVTERLSIIRDMPLLESDDEHVEKIQVKPNEVNKCKDKSLNYEKPKSYNIPVKHVDSIQQKNENETVVKRKEFTKIERHKSDLFNNNIKTKTDEKLIQSVNEKISGSITKKSERRPSSICDKAQESKRPLSFDQQKNNPESASKNGQTSSASHDMEPSTVLFSNEEIQKLNNNLANLENLQVGDEKSNETTLIDMEVEQIMCNERTNSETDCNSSTTITTRGKSCMPLGTRHLESPKLSRSKSLEARDFLCYTPFRITRSMSRNWSLSSGLPNSNENKRVSVRKRRQTVDLCEIPRKKKPSLFSEETPFIKPKEIDLNFTPRYQDEYVDEIETQQDSSNVTIVYNDVNPRDPRRKSGTKKINYNGRELVKYTDYVKENSSSSEQSCKSKETVSKKICSRRKSVSRKNDDPDYVPKCKLAVSPRCAEFNLYNAETDDAVVSKLNELQNNKTIAEKPCSITHNAEERISNRISMSVDQCISHSTNINNLKKSTNERKSVDLNEVTLKTDNIPTLTRKNTQKENMENKSDLKKKKSLNDRIKHSNDHVSSVSIELETTDPLTITEPQSGSATSFIQPLLKLNTDKATVNTAKTYKSNRQENRTSDFKPVKTPSKTLRKILDTLTSCIFMMRTLKNLKNTQCTALTKVPAHKEFISSEINVFNAFLDQRLLFWIKKFHKICATLNVKMCDVKTFVKHLTMGVVVRDPSLNCEDFIALLDLILKEPVLSTGPESYINLLKRSVVENKQMNVTRQRTIHNSAQNTTVSHNILTSETSTNSTLPQSQLNQTRPTQTSTFVPQQSQKNQTRPTTSSPVLLPSQGQTSTIVQQQTQKNRTQTQPITTFPIVFLPTQLDQLKTQIIKYKQLTKTKKRIERKGNTGKQNETVINKRNSGPNALRSLNIYERLNPKNNVPPSVPTNYNTPQKTPLAIDKSLCDPEQIAAVPQKLTRRIVIPVTESLSQTVSPQFIPVTVQNIADQQIIPSSTQTASKKENKRTYSSDIPQITIDLVSDNVNEEFVDLEKYFNKWNTKVISETSCNVGDVSVCNIGKETEGRSIHPGNFDDDPIPRSLSNDSGLESPSQVDAPSSLYENRACLCGKQAFYLCTCKAVMYCSTQCQVVDWSRHKNSMEHNS